MNSLQKMTQIDEQAEKILLEDNGGGNEQEEVDSLLDLRAKIVYSQLRDQSQKNLHYWRKNIDQVEDDLVKSVDVTEE